MPEATDSQSPPVLDAASQMLLEELDLGSARGGKKPRRELSLEVVRELEEADLEAIAQPPAVGAVVPTVKALRYSHHRLAELLAAGKPQGEISLITGYSQSYISNIKGDPAFQELVQYYASQKEQVFIDAMTRLKLVGLDATGKLHELLEAEGKTWTARELVEIIEATLLKPAAIAKAPGPGQAQAAPGNGFNLTVKFVGAQAAAAEPPQQTLDAQFTVLEGASRDA